MTFLLKMGIPHCQGRLPDGNVLNTQYYGSPVKDNNPEKHDIWGFLSSMIQCPQKGLMSVSRFFNGPQLSVK